MPNDGVDPWSYRHEAHGEGPDAFLKHLAAMEWRWKTDIRTHTQANRRKLVAMREAREALWAEMDEAIEEMRAEAYGQCWSRCHLWHGECARQSPATWSLNDTWRLFEEMGCRGGDRCKQLWDNLRRQPMSDADMNVAMFGHPGGHYAAQRAEKQRQRELAIQREERKERRQQNAKQRAIEADERAVHGTGHSEAAGKPRTRTRRTLQRNGDDASPGLDLFADAEPAPAGAPGAGDGQLGHR